MITPRHEPLPASGAPAGYLLVLVLVFGSVFFFIVSSFVGFVVTQNQLVNQLYTSQRALDVAEAGINFYRWHLAHRINEVKNGTLDSTPITRVYEDPEDGPIGEFTVTIASSTYCGSIAHIDVTSEGYVYDEPSLVRTISARYSRPTLAEYSYVIDSNVWAGDDRTIIGPYHSNQGVRMDGENQSLVTSGVTQWNCTSSFGCNPSDPNAPGVFTTTSYADPLRFNFAVNQIDFDGFNLSLTDMKGRATATDGGTYFPYSAAHGYRVVFNGDGTVTAYRVTNTRQVWGYSSSDGWEQERTVIDTLDTLNPITETINPDCPIVYVEDKVWLEGAVDQKVSLAAAGTDFEGNPASLILQDDITYSDPQAGLLAIAEDNVLLGVDVPLNGMEINGIFIASDGRFGRNMYCDPALDVYSCLRGSFFSPSDYSLPTDLIPYATPDSLTINGTIVSTGRVGTQWTQGGTYVSGFADRYSSYDRRLANDPPPLVPSANTAIYRFSNWKVEN